MHLGTWWADDIEVIEPVIAYSCCLQIYQYKAYIIAIGLNDQLVIICNNFKVGLMFPECFQKMYLWLSSEVEYEMAKESEMWNFSKNGILNQ